MKRRQSCLHHPLLLLLIGATPVAWAEEDKIMSAVTVSAEAGDIEERRTAATQKTVLGRKELENLSVQTVGEVLTKLPGIQGSAGSDGSMHMQARGMARDSVQIRVDGEPLSANARMALTMVSRLPAEELERVEIIRGTTAEYGSVPVTVNLVMRRALPKDTRSFKFSVGTRGGEPNGHLNLVRGGGDAGFSWLLPLTVFYHGSVSDKTLDRQNFASGVRTLWQVDRQHSEAPIPGLSFAPKFTWKQGADSFTLSPMVVYTDAARTAAMTRNAYADPAAGTGYAPAGGRNDRTEGDSRQLRLRAEAEKRLGGAKLSGYLAATHGNRSTGTVHDRYDALGNSALSYESLRRTEDELNGAVRLDRGLGSHLLAASLEAADHRRRDEQTLGTSAVYRAEERQVTAWLQDEWTPADALTVTGGLRGMAARLTVDGAGRDFSRLLPSLGVRWAMRPAWVLRSSIGAGLSLPKLDELTDTEVTSLSANTPLEPDQRGNPGLRPERSVNFEAALERYLPDDAGVLAANLYWRATRDFIERRVDLEGIRWVERPYNEGDARHWGLELDAKVNRAAWLPAGGSLRAHLTLPWAEVDDRRLGISRTARDTPSYQFDLNYDQRVKLWKGSAGFQLRRYGRVKTDIPDEQWAATDPRTVLDVYATRRLTPVFNLRLAVQNLFRSDTVSRARAWSGVDAWSLDSRDDGSRKLVLTLEGKW